MPTGDWCSGKTKDNDERVAEMARAVSAAMHDPELRKRLDDKKRLSIDEVNRRISASTTRWTVACITNYKSAGHKNIMCTCPVGHEQVNSLVEITSDVRCRTCEPRKRSGKKNPSYVSLDGFLLRLTQKHGLDRFRFDPATYSGVYAPMSFECAVCRLEFTKAPRVLLNERHGCARCASAAKSSAQARSREQFNASSASIHGGSFSYHPADDQTYGNASYIERTCNVCGTKDVQNVGSHLTGRHGCSHCSRKKKHTTESFTALARQVWGAGEFDYSQVVYVNNKTPVTLTCKNKHEFKCAPSNHLSRKGCPHCAIRKFVSVGETEWLDSLRIPPDNRNVWVKVDEQRFNVDALINGTIYEYYGDYWHGNTKRFAPGMINPFNGLSMADLHTHTIEREEMLRTAGYVVITMWESDWQELRKTRRTRQLVSTTVEGTHG